MGALRFPGAAALLASAAVLIGAFPSATSAETIVKGPARVVVSGSLGPRALPRTGSAPVSVSLAGHISPTGKGPLPQLRKISFAINSHGHLDLSGLPVCRVGHIQPSTNSEAIEACGSSLIGTGDFAANVKLPEQTPFPSVGKMLAFNGRFPCSPPHVNRLAGFGRPAHPRTRSGGDARSSFVQNQPSADPQSQSDSFWGSAEGPRPPAGTPRRNRSAGKCPAILAHVYGTQPASISYVLPFKVTHTKGTFGTLLEANLPQIAGEWGNVTQVGMTLGRTYRSHGQTRSYLSASCPAPKGFNGAPFPLLRTSFEFAGGPTLSTTLNRSCKVLG